MNLSGALEIARLTDVGLQREHNEDAVASDENLGFVVLADGMGGYKAGEVASEMAVLTIVSCLSDTLGDYRCGKIDSLLGKQSEAQLLIDAVKSANEVIYSVSKSQPQCEGMGTTLVVGIFTNNKLLVGHLGDSRMYRLRSKVLSQLTEDHSYLQEQIKAGYLSPEEARYSANKNLVTRALGLDAEFDLELNEYDVEVGDAYLLCSDGLTDMVEDEAIQALLNQYLPDINEAVKALIYAANKNGGSDNVSAILVKVNGSFECPKTWQDAALKWFR